MNTNKKALLIGINYENCSDAQLRGCENDAKHLQDFLLHHKFEKENIKVLCEPSNTTKYSIIENIHELIAQSWKYDLDEIFFSISCHGSQVQDFNHDEIDGLDECILPCDFRINGIIRDDLFSKLFSKTNPRTRVFCLIDACHSGTMLDLPFNYNYENDTIVMTKIKNENENENKNIICLSGCLDTQTSADAYNVNKKHEYSGAMTSCFIQTFNDSYFDVPVLELFKSLHKLLEQRSFNQRPTLSTSFMVNENTFMI